MEKTYRKAINFDLSIQQLKEYYPGPEYRMAYYDVSKFLVRRGFEHRQGSGYVSRQRLSTPDIIDLMYNMRLAMPWMGRCTRVIDVTNIGSQFEITDLLQTREAIERQSFAK